MRRIYIECKMGAAGDMLMGALYELLNEKQKEEFISKINVLFNNTICVNPIKTSKCNIIGTHMNVDIFEHSHSHTHTNPHTHAHTHGHIHNHYSYNSIYEKINSLDIDNDTITLAASIYKCIGNAEAHVHNSTLDNIHFHEVGSLDAMCDVVGCSMLINMLNIDEIIVSPIHVGNGTVKCAHGILPVPAPATAEILKGIPFYTGNIDSELCTPTGAAILKTIASRFDSMPVMNISKIGIGMGSKNFETANCVRIFLEETNSELNDTIIELSCNIDDMTGEELSFAMETLFDNGALDVFFTNIQMKKNRPAILLRCLCKQNEKEKFQQLIFKYTTTRGIRELEYDRVKLSSSFTNVETKYGNIKRKTSIGYNIYKSKYEYENLKEIAQKENISLFDLKKILPD